MTWEVSKNWLLTIPFLHLHAQKSSSQLWWLKIGQLSLASWTFFYGFSSSLNPSHSNLESSIVKMLIHQYKMESPWWPNKTFTFVNNTIVTTKTSPMLCDLLQNNLLTTYTTNFVSIGTNCSYSSKHLLLDFYTFDLDIWNTKYLTIQQVSILLPNHTILSHNPSLDRRKSSPLNLVGWLEI